MWVEGPRQPDLAAQWQKEVEGPASGRRCTAGHFFILSDGASSDGLPRGCAARCSCQ